jgi:hypothetical protein
LLFTLDQSNRQIPLEEFSPEWFQAKVDNLQEFFDTVYNNSDARIIFILNEISGIRALDLYPTLYDKSFVYREDGEYPLDYVR